LSKELTVGELMGLLEDERDDAIVRVVHQRHRPLQEVLGGVANSRTILDEDDEGDEDEPSIAGDGDETSTSVVYLVANGHPTKDSPYGSAGAWNAMRRGW
jgi:hypothetical protein